MATALDTTPPGANSARYWNVIIGIWLFISAFVWAHTPAQQTNTWLCGLLCIAFALWASAAPAVRYLNTALAVWLFISVWALPAVSAATVWNNIICSVLIFVISLIPGQRVLMHPAELGGTAGTRRTTPETRPSDTTVPPR